MAPLLLVVGALMSGAGLYAIIYGYSIIQLEQGWASVISGATLVAGGVVTIALGLVLRVLKQVRTGLLDAPPRSKLEPDGTAAASAAGEDAPATPPAPLPQQEPPITVSPSAGPAGPVLSFPVPEEVAPTRSILVPNVSPEPSTPHPPVSPFEPAQAEEAPDHAQRVVLEPAQSLPLQDGPAFEAPRPADDYKLDMPSTGDHDLPAPERHEAAQPFQDPASPPMDDWLDRAFAELDRDNPPLPPRRPEASSQKPSPGSAGSLASGSVPHLPPKVQSAAALEPVVAEAAAAAPSAGADLIPPTPIGSAQSPVPPPPSAIIGRYESDGTTYVMFADGSIEAQSASGVYRFASMAELKAYIEN